MTKVTISASWVSGNSDEVLDTLFANGMLRAYAFTADDNAGNRTFTFKVKDADGNEFYSNAGIAEDTTTVVSSLAVPIAENFQSSIEPSGDPGAGGANVTVQLFLEDI